MMTKTSIACLRPGFTAEFTLCGKAGARRHRIAGEAAAVLLLMLTPVPAMARSQMGPTSSATVGISLSIAPKYGLRVSSLQTPVPKLSTAGSGGLCMATNGQPTLLPILLVRSRAGKSVAEHAGKESAEPLGWCASGSKIDAPIASGEWKGMSGPLIIRPE